MKTLIIEDNNIASNLLKLILLKHNCTCDIASTGIEGMLLYFKHDYDLVFMDLGLPDINGISLTRLMRCYDNCNKHTPIVMITAHGEEKLKQSCLDVGVDLYLQKPIEQKQIHTVITMFSC
jgi:DNA-binding response OmpR family regulator